MILHLCVLEKFTEPFYRFTHEHGDVFGFDHEFYVNDLYGKFSIFEGQNIFWAQSTNWIARQAWLVRKMHEAEKIILHGLWDMRALLLLCLCPWLLKKCHWAIWGGDLYVHKHGKRNLAWRRNEMLRRFSIKRIGHFLTHLRGDYELARKWYGASGEWHDCFLYPSNLQPPPPESTVHQGINILLGNSADPANNHVDAIKKLKPLCEDGVTVFCPLSYGYPEYARKIIDHGKQELGDRFVPVLEYMPLSVYRCFLNKMDIAIFNHRRQQGVGIATTLLGFGKKVFMRQDTSSYQMFAGLGVELFSIDELRLEKLDDESAKQNAAIVKSCFSEVNLVEAWREIYFSA